MINLISSAAVTYEESGGNEINPLNVVLSIAYILIVMALIYVILLCIDKFAKKRQSKEAAPEEKTDKIEEEEKDG